MRLVARSIAVTAAAVYLAAAARAQPHADNPPAAAEDSPPAAAPGERAPEAAVSTGANTARLAEVVVEAKKPLSAASSQEINAHDFELRPHGNIIQLLNNIPGLVVAQHQGGNKAPQWLIRGFDADHGTDFAVFVDDFPVNLRSHAHGQGYADLNFVIPETIETYELHKGPYFPQFGDFANAGALNLVTREEFPENFVLAEGGSFDTQRYAAGGSPRIGNVKTLLAAQAYYTNGPFENAENLSSYKAFGKFTLEPTQDSKLSLSASGYQGDWDGSGQIPLRLVSRGQLDRFGSIDPTEGGRTDREVVDLHYAYTPTTQDTWAFQAYGSRYKLRLWSDFTFFKDGGLRFIQDPFGEITDTRDGPVVPGANYIPSDGIEQNDYRYLYGAKGTYTRNWLLLGRGMQTTFGLETRTDDAHVALHRQVTRNRFFTINKVGVAESSFSGYWAQQIFLTDWLRFEGGLRGDGFAFSVKNRLPRGASDPGSDPNFTGVPIAGNTSTGIFSPKANLVVTPEPNTDIYLNFGEGFHSNDARNTILGKNTDFSPLAKSLGYELGARTRQFDRLDAAAAIWLLDLDSELVFSGDAGNQEVGAGGTFEPAGKTRRWGIDFETRYQVTRWLYADYDLAYADPRFKNGDAIALAPTLLMNGGLTAEFASGFSVALRSRFLDDRPAIEDRSLIARGYFLLDLIARYRWRNVETSLSLLNLTDTDWREAQFADNSCVRGEVGRAVGCAVAPGKQDAHPADARPDIHFTPGNPFGVLAGLKIYF